MGELNEEERAALVIQCAARKHHARREMEVKRRTKQEEEDKWFEQEDMEFRNKCAVKIQQLFLQKLARRWRRTARRRSMQAAAGEEKAPVPYPASLYTPRGTTLLESAPAPSSPYPMCLYAAPAPVPPIPGLPGR